MKPVQIEDLMKYRIPGGLMYNPDGNILAFQVTEADEKKNGYRISAWVAGNGPASQTQIVF